MAETEKKVSSPPPEHLPSLHMVPSRVLDFVFPTSGWCATRILPCRKEPTVNCGESGASIKGASSSTSEDQSIIHKKPDNAELPWNLRRRRAFSKGESSKPVVGGLRKQKRKLTVPLSLKDIEADFLLMTGKKPHKRPKKRARHVQKEVDAVFPGLRLSEVTFNMYKVGK